MSRRQLMTLAVLALIASSCSGNAFELEVGQCLDEPETDEVLNVEVVACDAPHDLEVYRVADLPEQDFVETAVDDASFEMCLDDFDSFVGASYEDSELDIYYLIPSAESWADGDREVVCAVHELNGDSLVGTAAGIGR